MPTRCSIVGTSVVSFSTLNRPTIMEMDARASMYRNPNPLPPPPKVPPLCSLLSKPRWGWIRRVLVATWCQLLMALQSNHSRVPAKESLHLEPPHGGSKIHRRSFQMIPSLKNQRWIISVPKSRIQGKVVGKSLSEKIFSSTAKTELINKIQSYWFKTDALAMMEQLTRKSRDGEIRWEMSLQRQFNDKNMNVGTLKE